MIPKLAIDPQSLSQLPTLHQTPWSSQFFQRFSRALFMSCLEVGFGRCAGALNIKQTSSHLRLDLSSGFPLQTPRPSGGAKPSATHRRLPRYRARAARLIADPEQRQRPIWLRRPRHGVERRVHRLAGPVLTQRGTLVHRKAVF